MQEGSMIQSVEKFGARASTLITAYAFFPTFLQMGYVVYAVERWRGFHAAGYSILGALHNIALIVGSAILNPTKEASKELAFRVYRYTVVAHLMVYKYIAINPWFEEMTLQDVIDCGLLTKHEASLIAPSEGTKHELLVSWISKEIFDGVKDGLLSHELCPAIMLPTHLRGAMGALTGNLLTNQPNLWAALMRLVCDILVIMFVFGNPFINFMFEAGPFQIYAFLFTTFQAIPYLCAHILVKTLADPYTGQHDMFNTDSLVAWAESVCFTNLRCKFSWIEQYDNAERLDERADCSNLPDLNIQVSGMSDNSDTCDTARSVFGLLKDSLSRAAAAPAHRLEFLAAFDTFDTRVRQELHTA